jgi:hypothetical protein
MHNIAFSCVSRWWRILCDDANETLSSPATPIGLMQEGWKPAAASTRPTATTRQPGCTTLPDVARVERIVRRLHPVVLSINLGHFKILVPIFTYWCHSSRDSCCARSQHLQFITSNWTLRRTCMRSIIQGVAFRCQCHFHCVVIKLCFVAIVAPCMSLWNITFDRLSL